MSSIAPTWGSHRFLRHRASVASLSLLLCQLPAPVRAAEAPVTPGSVQDTLEPSRPRLPATSPQVVLPVQPAPSQHDPRAKRFRVNAFDMAGNTVFRTRLLKTLLERYVDMELNLHDLNRAADTITEFYHSRGYTLARAVIPAQKVVDGVVQIRIVEGRMGRVRFSGNKRFSDSFLAARTKQLQPGALVTAQSLEHDLLLLNDIPGLSAKAVLDPGKEFGTTDAEIKLTEKLLSVAASANNHGREETGREKLELTVNLNSPFGWGDQLSLSGSNTRHELVQYWKAGYSLPLNTVGTRLALSTSKAAYEVSGALAVLGLEGEVRTTEVGISHPVVRSRGLNHAFSIGAKRSHLVQHALDTEISNTKITVMNLGYQMNHIAEDASVTNFALGFATNFKSVDTPTQQDRLRARFDLDVNYTTAFVREWDLYLRGNMVHSAQMLPDTEKFSLGGPGSVRAYRPSEVRGDSGFLATAELRHPFSMLGKMGVFRLTSDIGQATYKMPGFKESRDRLRSIGVGAAFFPVAGVAASIDVARPFGSGYEAADGKHHRIWVNISGSF